MFDIKLNLVASIFYTEKNNRLFLSTEEKYYSVPYIALDKDRDQQGIDKCLNTFIYTYAPEIKDNYCPYYHLIGVKKNINLIEISYATMLPIDTKITSMFLVGYNLAIIDPLVRKAMSYV